MDRSAPTSSTTVGNNNNNTTFGNNNNNSGNTTYNIGPVDEKLELLQWLSPLESQSRHQDLRAGRFDGVGDWLLQTAEFQEWRGNEGGADSAVLFCFGEPGVGKTYLR